MTTALMTAYDNGVLDRGMHSRLAQNLQYFADRANIADVYILDKMSKFGCNDADIGYVRAIKRMAANKIFGLIYYGKETVPVMPRMMGVAGACVRNFVDAKVMTVQHLLADLKVGNTPDTTVLCIPNFFIAKGEGGKIADWHVPELLGLLYARMARGQQTLMYDSEWQGLRNAYGDPLADHLKNQFKQIPA